MPRSFNRSIAGTLLRRTVGWKGPMTLVFTHTGD